VSAPEPQLSPQGRPAWLQESSGARQVLQRQGKRVWLEWKRSPVFQESFSFLLEPIRRVQLSLRPGSWAAPPSVSVHLPAAVSREISFRPA